MSTPFLNYQSRLNFFRRFTLAVVVIQLIVSIYYLFVPQFTSRMNYDQFIVIITGIFIVIIGLLLAGKIVDLDADRTNIMFRILTIIGLIHQHLLDIDTLFVITIYSLAAITQVILINNMETIKRTQHFASHEKITPEVRNAVLHADEYMKHQIKWITDVVIFLLAVAIISILMFKFITVLPSLLSNVEILQYISIFSLITILVFLTVQIFPNLEEPKDEYEIFN